MNLIDFKKALFLLLALLLLFGIKILFLNTANQSIAYGVFEILILILSLYVLGYFIYKNKNEIVNNASIHKSKLFIYGSMIVIESLFIVKNSLLISNSYLFSIFMIYLILLFISLLLPKVLSKMFDCFVLIIFSIYVLSQDFFYRIFSDFYSFKEAPTIKEGAEASEGMFKLEALYILIGIILIYTLVYYFKKYQKNHFVLTYRFLKKFVSLILLLFILLTFNLDFMTKDLRLHTSDLYLYKTIYNRPYYARKFGMIHLMFSDFFDSIYIKNGDGFDIQYIQNYLIENSKNHQPNTFTNMFENKNLIFILAESYDELALSQELTPNLYKLKNEGIDFQNHFTPVFPRTTSDTEFIINTSLIPSIEDGPTISRFKMNSYNNSLAMLFNNKGYNTVAFHGNNKSFYSRDLIYENYGYNYFYDQIELGLSNENKKFDQTFFQYAKDYITNSDDLFFSFIITYSGHSPYSNLNNVANKHYDLVNDKYQNTLSETLKYYIATQIELDLMINDLMLDLEEKNLLDDTVIILTGDHFPYTMNQYDYENITNIKDNHLKQRGNLYIWQKDIIPYQYIDLTSSFDILPIIINMFSLSNYFDSYIGNDIYQTNKNTVLYKDYKIFTGSILLNLNDRFIDQNLDLVKLAEQNYRYSKSVLRTNYYKIP